MAAAGKVAELEPLRPAIEVLAKSASDAGVRDFARKLAEKFAETAEAPAGK